MGVISLLWKEGHLPPLSLPHPRRKFDDVKKVVFKDKEPA
jgi:hypothetical protein